MCDIKSSSREWRAIRVVVAVLLARVASSPVIARQTASEAVIDQATAFVRFAETTATQSGPLRITKFHASFDPLLPGFYRCATLAAQAALDVKIAAALTAFPRTALQRQWQAVAVAKP